MDGESTGLEGEKGIMLTLSSGMFLTTCWLLNVLTVSRDKAM